MFRANTQERTFSVITTHCNGFPAKQCNRGSILGRSGNIIAFLEKPFRYIWVEARALVMKPM